MTPCSTQKRTTIGDIFYTHFLSLAFFSLSFLTISFFFFRTSNTRYPRFSPLSFLQGGEEEDKIREEEKAPIDGVSDGETERRLISLGNAVHRIKNR